MLFHSSCVVCVHERMYRESKRKGGCLVFYMSYIFFGVHCTLFSIDKLYTEIGKVFLPWELNLLLSCFGLLALSRHCSRTYTETVDPACRPSIPEQWYWHGTVRECTTGVRWFNWTEDASDTCLFRSCYCILFIYAVQYSVPIYLVLFTLLLILTLVSQDQYYDWTLKIMSYFWGISLKHSLVEFLGQRQLQTTWLQISLHCLTIKEVFDDVLENIIMVQCLCRRRYI